MPAARLPDCERERLEELHSFAILDTLPDAGFDSIVQLAGQIFGTPISLVSLVDRERQWFKARAGLSVAETSRDVAFCAHTILDPDHVMVVENARLDPRFCDNPLVTGAPDVCFYAGAPIVSSRTGHAMGTLCVIDHIPRSFSPSQVEMLRTLAHAVSSQMDLHRSSLRLRQAQSHDPLTGLVGRALFEKRLEAAVQNCSPQAQLGVIYIDLDRFKVLNDLVGHETADEVLRTAGSRIQSVIGARDLAARLGGDEFCVLMRDPLQPGAAKQLAEVLLHELKDHPIHIKGRVLELSASLGFATLPENGRDGPSILRASEMAVYEAKRTGRGRCISAADIAGPGTRHPDLLEFELRKALTTGDIVVAWQPYTCLRDGVVVGFEALARWTLPGVGPITPATFVPLAEQCGLIRELDEYMLRTACKAAAAWPQPWLINVNLSPIWFSNGDTVGLVEKILTETGLAPRRLKLELTERTMMEHPHTAAEQMRALRQLGVRIALDDFGTGYSCLGSISEFEIDEIKLDISFVRKAGVDPRADAVMRCVISLARELKIRVCAEGVETAQQLAIMRQLGCQTAQGYLIGRPSIVDPGVVQEQQLAQAVS